MIEETAELLAELCRQEKSKCGGILIDMNLQDAQEQVGYMK